MIKIGDIILGVALILLAVVIFLGTVLLKAEGSMVVISIDGKVYGEYSLSEDKEVEISTEKGNNTIVIKDGKVSVSSADCPDLYCVSHVAIDSTEETIVCLPHKVVVSIRE